VVPIVVDASVRTAVLRRVRPRPTRILEKVLIARVLVPWWCASTGWQRYVKIPMPMRTMPPEMQKYAVGCRVSGFFLIRRV
jgi:hypothetical protein